MPALQAFCQGRLDANEQAHVEFKAASWEKELEETRSDESDFYQIPKVDTHLHLSAMMTTPELVEYMLEIYHTAGERKIGETTIAEMLRAEGFDPDNQRVSIDHMCTMANKKMFKNFEEFNLAFQPMRSKPIKDLIFKPKSLDGEYLEKYITRQCDRAQKANIVLEPRISIKGRHYGEWEELAKWVHRRQVVHKHLAWAVQLPRIYQIWHGRNVQSFGELVTNFFGPLFDATLHPEKHPELAWFLTQCLVIDTVDNEDKQDDYDISKLPAAVDYTVKDNPPYAYYHFYWWANMRALNRLRAERNMPLLQLRPHAGEAGAVHHLASAFLFADGISHGINLAKQPVLQYLYYLADIGISVSPISNKALFLPYVQNPFPKFFERGLNVTLTTDDPLMFHMTPTPLLEEYAHARTVWNLSMTDISEIAYNSLRLSSLSAARKAELGMGNAERLNIPKRRTEYRAAQQRRNFTELGLNTRPKA